MNEATGRKPFDYLAESEVTCSPEWFGHMVPYVEFSSALALFIEAGNRMDKIKKAIFYGRTPNPPFPHSDSGIDCSELPTWLAPNSHVAAAQGQSPESGFKYGVDMFHAMIGMMTESVEIAEALQASVIFGKPFDVINVNEEIGDFLWYAAITHRREGRSFNETMRRNIAKLRTRFPDRFTAFDANNRDLLAERAVLEHEHREIPPVGRVVPAHIPGETVGDYTRRITGRDKFIVPTFDEANARIEAGDGSTLDKFIVDHCPGKSSDEMAFYLDLAKLIGEAKAGA